MSEQDINSMNVALTQMESDAHLYPDLTEEELKLLSDIRRAKQQLLKEIHDLENEIANVTADLESMDYDDGGKGNNQAKQMHTGRKKFNTAPKKGIQFLIEQQLLQETPEDVAQFLYKGEGLNKTAIGDYLGERPKMFEIQLNKYNMVISDGKAIGLPTVSEVDKPLPYGFTLLGSRNDFNIKVLEAFVALHEFKDMILVQALRQFLWSFRLPGEAQKIDRMMESFAKRYCETNPGVFESTDTCYVLSFAIIMLNTSLHNPSVRDKPTLERFIQMNRGINEGKDLQEELLKSLYDSIKKEPFKIPEDDGNDLTHTFFNPDKEGWLLKQGGRYRSWKRRWFILTDNCLYYFEFTTDKEPRGIIPLENLLIREVDDKKQGHCFELYAADGRDIIKACKTDTDGKVVEGKHMTYRMSASNQEEKVDWIKVIRASIAKDPFYEMLAARKKKASGNN